MLKLYFYTQFCHNSDMFLSTLINFRDILNTSKTYIQGVTGGMDQTSGGCSLC